MIDKQTENVATESQGSDTRERILVIKLSALGDLVLAMGPFAAIRAAHPDAHITVLTTKPYVDLMKASGFFDSIAIDRRPKLTQVREVLALRRFLKNGRFDRVYDLQTSDRQGSISSFSGLDPSRNGPALPEDVHILIPTRRAIPCTPLIVWPNSLQMQVSRKFQPRFFPGRTLIWSVLVLGARLS